jgi:hypothetical protein
MSTNFQKKAKFMTLKPMLGDTFAHRPNQRIELQRNPSNNITTAIIWKNLNGRGGIVRYQVDEKEGIISV